MLFLNTNPSLYDMGSIASYTLDALLRKVDGLLNYFEKMPFLT